MAPKARQAKGKARLAAYDKLPGRGRGGRPRPDKLQIQLPPGRRLGGVVIEADDVAKGYGDRLLIDDLTFKLPPAGIVGVIGPNGAGKTTLFRMITGQEQPDAGTFTVGDTVDLAYVDQSRDSLDAEKTVYEEITGSTTEFMKVGNREVNGRAYVCNFNFKGSDQQKKVGVLSGGERNRVHLAKMLKEGANVLLLDEPTNDLDVDTLRALEDALEAFAGCAVVISHDRWFLDRIATHILAFEGDSQVRWFEGNFSEYEAWRKKELARADQPHRIKYKPLSRSVPVDRWYTGPPSGCRSPSSRRASGDPQHPVRTSCSPARPDGHRCEWTVDWDRRRSAPVARSITSRALVRRVGAGVERQKISTTRTSSSVDAVAPGFSRSGRASTRRAHACAVWPDRRCTRAGRLAAAGLDRRRCTGPIPRHAAGREVAVAGETRPATSMTARRRSPHPAPGPHRCWRPRRRVVARRAPSGEIATTFAEPSTSTGSPGRKRSNGPPRWSK